MNMILQDLYSRQQPLNLKPIKEAVVIGVGGVGSWLAIFLAMSGTEKFILCDMDRIEPSNLARIPVAPHQVDQYKVDAIADMIHLLRPEARFENIAYSVLDDLERIKELAAGGAVVFDCTDRVSVQLEIEKAVPGRIRVGYDGTQVTVTNGAIPKWGDMEDSPYAFAPTWAAGAAFAGVIGAAFVQLGAEGYHTFDLRTLLKVPEPEAPEPID